MTDASSRAEAGSGRSQSGPESDSEGFDERSLLFLVVPEVVAFAVLCAFLANSVLGDGAFLASYPPWMRLAAFAAAAAQCLVVVWVSLDARRRPEMGPLWVHAAATPVLNVFGLAAYLDERKRKAGERWETRARRRAGRLFHPTSVASVWNT